MKTPSKTGGKPAKARRRSALKAKRRSAPKTPPRSGPSHAGQETEVARLTRENARLRSEVRENLQQKTAISEVLTIISRSTFDLAKVLRTVLELAARLSEADKGVILRPSGDTSYYAAATYRHAPEFIESEKGIMFGPGRSGVAPQVLLEGKSVQIPDALNDPEYPYPEFARLGDFRTILGVRQAVIAIENVRLFEAEQQRTRELARSIEDLRSAQDRLVQTEKLASLGQLTAGIAHEIKNPLNFVNNFSGVSVELIDELQQALETPQLDNKARGEITELANTLRSNLDKIVQHGKRADAIVKNMLLHSREGSSEHRPIDVNNLVEESLNLAYHGARAEKQGFTITLERSFDPSAGQIDVFPQEITRALLNLISNGFYAATKREGRATGDGFEPTLRVATKNLGDRVEIRIRDNGTGVPPEVKEKMFTPFFTTKPAGEGTGLGLSISHDIIVKQHAGSIEVDTQPGEFTEFKIILPRVAASVAKSGR
jgi:signal transduction histidine kinase